MDAVIKKWGNSPAVRLSSAAESAWNAEIRQRVAELDAKAVETVPWSQVRDRLFRGFE